MEDPFTPGPETIPTPPDSIWAIVEQLGLATDLTQEYCADQLLDPLAALIPDYDGAAKTIVEIYCRFGWTPEQIINVLVDIHNNFNVEERLGSAKNVELQHPDKQTISFTLPPKLEVVDRPLPLADLGEDAIIKSNTKERIAEDIARYVASCASTKDRLDPNAIQLYAEAVEPFLAYADMQRSIQHMLARDNPWLPSSDAYSQILRHDLTQDHAEAKPDEFYMFCADTPLDATTSKTTEVEQSDSAGLDDQALEEECRKAQKHIYALARYAISEHKRELWERQMADPSFPFWPDQRQQAVDEPDWTKHRALIPAIKADDLLPNHNQYVIDGYNT